MINIAKSDLEKAKHKEHILEGLLIAIKDIDTAINLIKESENKDEARKKLIFHFKITEIQSNAVLDMKLSKLTKLDKDDLIKELEELRIAIAKYTKIINEQVYRDIELKEKVKELRDKYGDERRTVITQIQELNKEEKEIEFVEPEKCVVVLTESGNIKRVPTSSFRTQKRNGKGVKTQDDITNMVLRTNTIDSLMIFTDKGKMFRLLVNDIPVGTNISQGQSVKSLVNMEINENPVFIYSIYRDTDAKYVFFTTKRGTVKKTSLEEYIGTKKKSGVVAINLRENDEIASVCLVKDESMILLTKSGMGIKFNSLDVGATSRATIGVKGINIKEDDEVIVALPVRNKKDKLAIFTSNGLGKKFNLDELPIQNKGGKGLICYKPNGATGDVVSGALVADEDNLLLCGNKSGICISATEIPSLGRNSIGNQLIKGNNLLSVSKV